MESINCVKCFQDLIPRAVVLGVALELNMDPGTCGALVLCTSRSTGPPRFWLAAWVVVEGQ